MFEIEHERAFVAIQMQKLGAHSGRDRFSVHDADQVAALALDLDYIGAMVGEDLRGKRTDDHRSEIDDGDARKRSAGHQPNSAVALSASAPLSSTTHNFACLPSGAGSPQTVSGRLTNIGRTLREEMNLSGAAACSRASSNASSFVRPPFITRLG